MLLYCSDSTVFREDLHSEDNVSAVFNTRASREAANFGKRMNNDSAEAREYLSKLAAFAYRALLDTVAGFGACEGFLRLDHLSEGHEITLQVRFLTISSKNKGVFASFLRSAPPPPLGFLKIRLVFAR